MEGDLNGHNGIKQTDKKSKNLPVDLVKEKLDIIKEKNRDINAFITVAEKRSIRKRDRIRKRVREQKSTWTFTLESLLQ